MRAAQHIPRAKYYALRADSHYVLRTAFQEHLQRSKNGTKLPYCPTWWLRPCGQGRIAGQSNGQGRIAGQSNGHGRIAGQSNGQGRIAALSDTHAIVTGSGLTRRCLERRSDVSSMSSGTSGNSGQL